MDIEFGNLDNLDTNGTGWFIGFSDWTMPVQVLIIGQIKV
ncbi:hypothetical protein Lepto7375DRAFT_2538 [Leptolyngbya sp. PCC 7375]|nr:hypothetical protein Lepto7375DRAFT_2538 [Leptolyngbya sp. PCC 7375]